MFVDVLDNRKDCSADDAAECYTYSFVDDFPGWKQMTVQFTDMVRKDIGSRAPRDGLGLSEVQSKLHRRVTRVMPLLDIFVLHHISPSI